MFGRNRKKSVDPMALASLNSANPYLNAVHSLNRSAQGMGRRLGVKGAAAPGMGGGMLPGGTGGFLSWLPGTTDFYNARGPAGGGKVPLDAMPQKNPNDIRPTPGAAAPPPLSIEGVFPIQGEFPLPAGTRMSKGRVGNVIAGQGSAAKRRAMMGLLAQLMQNRGT